MHDAERVVHVMEGFVSQTPDAHHCYAPSGQAALANEHDLESMTHLRTLRRYHTHPVARLASLTHDVDHALRGVMQAA
jgi:hypothetical protein